MKGAVWGSLGGLRLCRRMKNTSYLGAVPHEKIIALLKQAHCLVLPSLWAENAPIIVREAAAAGLEIICSEQGGAKEIAPHAHCIPNGDPTALHHAIQAVCRTYRRRSPVPYLSMEDHAAALQRIYESLYASRRGGQ